MFKDTSFPLGASAEMYLETCQTSMMKLFSENNQLLKTFYYFFKKTPSKVLKSNSYLLKKFVLFASTSPLKLMIFQVGFLCHLKSSFRSQDNWIFGLSFWWYRKNGLIRKIRLISKFRTSQPGKQTTKDMLPNTSRSKGKQALKFDQLTECNKRNSFLQN